MIYYNTQNEDFDEKNLKQRFISLYDEYNQFKEDSQQIERILEEEIKDKDDDIEKLKIRITQHIKVQENYKDENQKLMQSNIQNEKEIQNLKQQLQRQNERCRQYEDENDTYQKQIRYQEQLIVDLEEQKSYFQEKSIITYEENSYLKENHDEQKKNLLQTFDDCQDEIEKLKMQIQYQSDQRDNIRRKSQSSIEEFDQLQKQVYQLEEDKKILINQNIQEQIFFSDFLQKYNELDDENKFMKIKLEQKKNTILKFFRNNTEKMTNVKDYHQSQTSKKPQSKSIYNYIFGDQASVSDNQQK